MPLRILAATIAATALTTFSSTAHATQARVDGLLANPGFADDTDVLVYPSTISGVGDALNINYAGNVDAGVVWDKSNMLWIGRGVPTSLATGLAPSPWQIVYGKSSGDSGFLVRSSWQAAPAAAPAGPGAPAASGGGAVLSVGGGWGTGGYGRETNNLAITGDITAHGDVAGEGEDLKLGIDLAANGRSLTDSRLLAWMARISTSSLNELTLAGGTFAIGPRMSVGSLKTAVAIVPGLYVIKAKDSTSLATQLPNITLSAEYALREWFLIRGGASAGWLFSAADIEEITETDAWAVTRAGAIGMGFKHGDNARLDLSMSPTWLVAGPHLLSGMPNNTFLTVSGQASF
jgi:hypothetical protein